MTKKTALLQFGKGRGKDQSIRNNVSKQNLVNREKALAFACGVAVIAHQSFESEKTNPKWSLPVSLPFMVMPLVLNCFGGLPQALATNTLYTVEDPAIL